MLGPFPFWLPFPWTGGHQYPGQSRLCPRTTPLRLRQAAVGRGPDLERHVSFFKQIIDEVSGGGDDAAHRSIADGTSTLRRLNYERLRGFKLQRGTLVAVLVRPRIRHCCADDRQGVPLDSAATFRAISFSFHTLISTDEVRSTTSPLRLVDFSLRASEKSITGSPLDV